MPEPKLSPTRRGTAKSPPSLSESFPKGSREAVLKVKHYPRVSSRK